MKGPAAELAGSPGAMKLSGDMALRSSDSVAALLWLGAQAGYDLSAVAETVDEPLLQRMGLETGLDLEKIIHAAGWLGSELHRPVPGMLSRAGTFPDSQ